MSPLEEAMSSLGTWPGLIEDVFVIGDPEWPHPLVVVRLATGRTVLDAGAEAALLCHTAGLHAGLALDFCVVEFGAFVDTSEPALCVDRRTKWEQVGGRLVPVPVSLAPGTLAGAISRIHSF